MRSFPLEFDARWSISAMIMRLRQVLAVTMIPRPRDHSDDLIPAARVAALGERAHHIFSSPTYG